MKKTINHSRISRFLGSASARFTCASIMALALAAVPANAATVLLYSDDFSGSSANPLDGTTPDTTTGTNTWIAHENWKADGSIAATSSGQDHNAFLAFTPTSGFIYTLSATLPQPSGSSGSGRWAAIGFTNATLGATTASNAFWDGANAATAWMLYRDSNNIAAFAGPGTAGGSGNIAYSGTRTMTVVLDTTAAQWKVEWFVDATSIHEWTYTTNPTISYVGLGRANGVGADFSSFSLTAIPEPSAALLGGLGLLALLRRRRN